MRQFIIHNHVNRLESSNKSYRQVSTIDGPYNGEMIMPEQPGPGKGQNPPAASGSSFMLIMMMLMMFLIFDPNLRSSMGNLMGFVLEPVIGMDNAYPMWSIFFAGSIMVFISTTARHFLMDNMKMARIQNVMSSFRKEMQKARQENNQARLNKLMETQKELMAMQGELMNTQMKPTFLIMFVAIPIFTWIRHFVGGLDHQAISLPWEPFWDLNTSKGTLLPHWIIIYSSLSIPLGQLYRRTLLLLKYRKRLALDAATIQERAEAVLRKLETQLNDRAGEGLPVENVEKTCKKARRSYQRKNYETAMTTAKEAQKALLTLEKDYGEAKRLLDGAKSIAVAIGEEPPGTADVLKDAEEKLKEGDFESSRYYSKKAKRALLKAKEKADSKAGKLASLEEKFMEAEETEPLLNLEKARACLEEAKECDSAALMEEHLDQAEREFRSAGKHLEEAVDALESAGNMLERARDAGCRVEDLEKDLGVAKSLHREKQHREAVKIAKKVRELSIRRRKAAVSMEKALDDARLEIVNAKNLDLDVGEAEAMLNKAVKFAESGKHEEAIEFAGKAAGKAKRLVSDN